MSALGSVRAASVNQPHPTAPSTIPFHKSLRSDDARGCEGAFYGLPASRRLPHGRDEGKTFSLAEESENNERRKIYDEKGNKSNSISHHLCLNMKLIGNECWKKFRSVVIPLCLTRDENL